MSNSPPFGLPSRECADDYLDKTVEQLAEEMGQKVKKKTCFVLVLEQSTIKHQEYKKNCESGPVRKLFQWKCMFIPCKFLCAFLFPLNNCKFQSNVSKIFKNVLQCEKNDKVVDRSSKIWIHLELRGQKKLIFSHKV